ncbi:hypothetical protein RBSWK_04623 [Rhodopirellula baltica SWK14]|uniref:Uncharacterized protein n=1 Tax=Rhodopirellula baltica SWK14 TaxID=993516 RepID=L7CCE7_RHOBT|nr:hypothetical protein RBSWK_04623 [Rhodopirellula baltica SWK14]
MIGSYCCDEFKQIFNPFIHGSPFFRDRCDLHWLARASDGRLEQSAQ